MNFGYCGDEGWTCAACMMDIDATQFPECGAPLGLSDERKSYPNDWREDERLPRCTASLDAAMTLVAGKDLWAVGDDSEGAFARITPGMAGGGYLGSEQITVFAATPALALCAAALRARSLAQAQQEKSDE